MLKNEAIRRAIVLAEGDLVPEELQRLAKDFSETVDGKLAQLILSGNNEPSDSTTAATPFHTDDPLSLATLILAVQTPYSVVGKNLAEAFAAIVAEQDAETHGMAKQSALGTALRIARGHPNQYKLSVTTQILSLPRVIFDIHARKSQLFNCCVSRRGLTDSNGNRHDNGLSIISLPDDCGRSLKADLIRIDSTR